MSSTKNPCKPTACSCKIEQLINVACEPNESRRILVYDCKKGKVVTLPFSTLAFDCASLLECPTIIAILEDIAALQAALTALAARVTTAEGNITTIQGQITSINASILAIQGDITTIQGQITTIQGQITALQLLAHTQNTDTGTTQSTFRVNSGGNGPILSSSGLTGVRTVTFFDFDGRAVAASEVLQILPLNFYDAVTAGGDVQGLHAWKANPSITGISASGMTSPFGSYRVNAGAWTNLPTVFPATITATAGQLIEFSPLDAAGTSLYVSGVAPFSGIVTINFAL